MALGRCRSALNRRALRHGDGPARHDVYGLAIGAAGQSRVLQQVPARAQGDVAGTAGQGVERDVAGSAVGGQEQITRDTDARAAGGTDVDSEAARRAHQMQLAVRPCSHQILLAVCRSGSGAACGVDTVDSEAQRVDGQAVGLGDVAAAGAAVGTVAHPAAFAAT